MRNPTIAYPFAQCKAELREITTERHMKNSTSNKIVSPIAVESASRPHVFVGNRVHNANDKKDPIEAKPRPSHGIISDSKSSSADRIVPRVKPRPPNSKNEVPYDFMMRTQSTKHSNVLQTRSGSQVPRVSYGNTEGSVEGSILTYPLDARSRMKISDTPHSTTFSLAKDCTPENSVRLKSAPAVTKSPSHPIPQPRPQALTLRVAQEKPGFAGTYTQSPSSEGLQIVKCSKSEEVSVVSGHEGSYTRSRSLTRPPTNLGPAGSRYIGPINYQSGRTHTSYTRSNSNPSRSCAPETSARFTSAPAVTESKQPRPQARTFRKHEIAQAKAGHAGTYTQVSSFRGLQTLKCSNSEEVRAISGPEGSYTRSRSLTRPPTHSGPARSRYNVPTHYQSGRTHTSYTRSNSNPSRSCTRETSVRFTSAPAVTESNQPRPQALTFRKHETAQAKAGPAGAYTQVSSSRGLQTLKCSKSEEVRAVSGVKGSYTRSNSWTRPPAHFGPTSGHSVTTHYQSGLTHTSYTRRNSNPSRYLQHLQSAWVSNHGIKSSVSANGVKSGATPNYSMCDFRDGKKSYGRDPRWIQQRQVSAPSITRCQTIGAQYQSEGSALRQTPRNWPESPSSRIAQRLAVTSALKRELTTTSTSEPMIKFVDKVPGSSIKSQLRSENEYQHGEYSNQTDEDRYQIGDKGYKPSKILYPSSGKKNQSEVFASAERRAMNVRRGCGNHSNRLFRRESEPHMRSSVVQNNSSIDLSELRDVLSPLNAADRDLTRSMGSILDRKNHSVYTAPTRYTMATTRQTRQHAAQLKAESDAQYKPDKQPKYEQATGYARPMYAMNGNASILTKRSRSHSVDGHFVSNTHRLGSQPQTVNMNYTTVPLTNASPTKACNKLSRSATGTDVVNGQDKLSMSKFTSWK